MQQVTGILSPGTIVQDQYTVEELLGRGGFGAVYRVRDQNVPGQLFALKEIADPSRQGRNRLIHEWNLLQQLHHPVLPRVYRVFDTEQGDRAYLLMEYIEGTNLEILRRQQPEKSFSLSEVFAIIAPIIDALAYLHHQQPPILHRDIKPANIILTTTGDKAVLVDFGIAKEYDPDDTTTTLRHCSPGYGAPEQYGTGTDPRTDIYGLAATLYTLLTGLVPADALHRMTRVGNTGMDPLEPVNQVVPAVPTFVAAAIHRALSLRSGDRFSTVEQFWGALHAPQPSLVLLSSPAMFADPSSATMQVRRGNPAAFSQKPPRSFRSRSLGVLLLVLLALVIGAGLGMGFWSAVASHPGAGSASPVTPQHTATAASPTSTLGPTATQPAATCVINDAAGILDQQQVCQAARALPYSLVVNTSSAPGANGGTAGASEPIDAQTIVLTIMIGRHHGHGHEQAQAQVTITGGSAVSLTSDQYQAAEDAFNQAAQGGDYTAATLAALQALQENNAQ